MVAPTEISLPGDCPPAYRVGFFLLMRPTWTRAFQASSICRENYYQILGVSVNATGKEIKKKFYELSRRYHPDRNKGGDLEKYQQITAAYQVLSNDDARKRFDLTLGEAVRQPEGYSRAGSASWKGTTRARSGYQFHAHTPKYAAHKDRSNPNLDPLRPKHRDHSVNDTPHFDAAKHFAAQQRNEARVREARRQQEEAAKRAGHSGHQSGSGSAFMGIAGTAAAGAALIYLLFR